MLAASALETAYRYADWNKQVCSNNEFGEIYEVMLQNSLPDFSESEWNRMSAFIRALFYVYEAQYINHKFDVGIGDQTESHVRTAKWAIENFPVVRKFWDEVRFTGFWTEGFEEAVEGVEAARTGGVLPIGNQ